MATTTNYSWSTPDDTALVKDGAAAIRSLGTAIDTTVFTNAGNAIQKSIVDVKGDIIAATASDTVARLAVGANDTVLTADSSTATGLKWAAPAGGGSNWSLLNSGGTALTGAQTITVSGISGKNKIMIIVQGASSASINSYIRVRLNTDTGNNYYWTGNLIQSSNTYNSSNFQGDYAFPGDSINLAKMSNNVDSLVHGYALIDGCNSSGVKIFQASGGAETAGGTGQNNYNLGGYYNSASTISSISLFSNNGNFDAGTVYVYTTA
jgi:hypothetical protein